MVSCFVSVRAAGIVGSICVDAVGACSAGCIRIGPVPPRGGCLLGMDSQRGLLIFVRPAQIKYRGLPCRFSEAVLFRRLQLAASDPPRSRDGFEWIARFALFAGERAPALGAGRRRQNKGGPALGACRSLVLSHGSNLPPDSLASPFQIQAAEKDNSAHL